MPNFAEKLTAARTAAGLSQYALAKRSGVSKQALSDLEKGLSEPKLETASRLARALGITVDALVGNGGQAPPAKKARRKK